MIFLSFLSIIGFTFFLSNYTTLRTVTPFFAIASVMLVLFLLGAMGILGIGAKILMVLGLILLVFSCFKITRQAVIGRETLWQAWSTRISLGTFFFVVVGIVWFVLTRKATVFGWDEFSWAEFVKAIKVHNGFYRPGDSVQVDLRYPPASQLFQYFFITFSKFKESALYFGHGLILLATTALIIDFSSKKILDVLVAMFVPLMFIIYFYGVLYPSIVTDPILGAFFGVGLILAIFYKPFPKVLLILFPILALLPLIKETGIILSSIVSGIFIARLLLEKNWINPTQKYDIVKTIFMIVIALITPLITRQIWLGYLKSVHIGVPYHSLTLDVIKSLLFHPVGKAKIIADNFYSAMFTTNIVDPRPVPFRHFLFHRFSSGKILSLRFSGSILAWACMFSIIYVFSIYFAYFRNIREFLKKLFLYLIVLGGLAGYLLFYYVAYNLFFSEYEGVGVAAFGRYMTSYALALSLLTTVAFLLLIKQRRGITRVFLAGLALIAITHWFFLKGEEKKFLSIVWDFESNPQSSASIYQELSTLLQLIDKYVPANANTRIWFVYQNSRGSETTVFRYAAFPRIVGGGSMGDKYYKGDIWTLNYTVEEFSKLIKDEDYLGIGRADENFWRHYGSMFRPSLEVAKRHVLFKVNVDKAIGQVFFEPVGEGITDHMEGNLLPLNNDVILTLFLSLT